MQDFRFSLRLVRQHPWFSAAILVTIALGIGVNTTIFTLVNAVLFKPLPFPGGERLLLVGASQPAQGRDFFGVNLADIDDIRKATERSFERMEGYWETSFTITEKANPPEQFPGAFVTAGLFELIATRPVLGRGFAKSDEAPGATPVALISHGVWKDRYGGDPGIVGRQIRLNEKPAVIAGVMPEGFRFPQRQDLWTVAIPPDGTPPRNERNYLITALPRPGAGRAAAQSELDVAARRLAEQYPATHKEHGLRAQTFHEAMNGGPIRLVFLLMLGAVGFVLLIACANVANMLLSRAVGREREIAIRSAMGATRGRVARQLLLESVVLSAAGGLAGLTLAWFGIPAFDRAVANAGKPYWIDFSMDWNVALYFAAICILSGLLFGLAPALRASRVDLNETLKDGTRGSDGKRGGMLSAALVVFQFALAVVLLSGAGLMIRSFLHAQAEFAQIPSERILGARVRLPRTQYETPERRVQFFERLAPRLRAIAGVHSASFVSSPPGAGGAEWRVELPGQNPLRAEDRPVAVIVSASPGYFATLQIPLRRGREFSEADGMPGKESLIVTQHFADRFFPGQDAVGKQVRFHPEGGQPKPWMTIVGVAPDIRQQNGPNQSAPNPAAFVPYRAEPYARMFVMLRTGANAAATGPELRRMVQEIDTDLPVSEMMTLDAFFDRGRWYLRVFGTLFSLFAAIAMGMAAVGIYAVIAHSVGRRTREIGVRVALGASGGNILGLVLRRGLAQIGLGWAIGLAAALGVCRLMSSVLFQVSPSDPLTFGAVSATLLAAGVAACLLPALKAARMDPLTALRYE